MTSLEDDLKHLHDKVAAGADFIITQMFYDVDLFLAFVERCRAIHIRCPIIPGIMPVRDYASFKRMTSFCKTSVPSAMLDDIESIKHDEARLREYGINQAVFMCRRLLASGVPGLHFYTLNSEQTVVRIVQSLQSEI
jgi:methylenetetrahydrofolate reductase (NADPH)